jgi:ComF family protein
MNLQPLKDLRHGLVHLFYPRLCEGCSKPLHAGEQVLCISCNMQLPETNYSNIADNETALRFAGRIPFEYATTLAWFTNDGLLQHLMHGLKYKNKKEIGYCLGRRLGQSLQKTEWIHSVDMIIPVPLHPAKKAKRGYNQSMLIAEGMSGVLHIPAMEGILLRVRDTESQTRKTRAERVSNMAAAFTIHNPAQLKGKHILLCDDVLTTGATLEAYALTLQKEESIKISLVTVGIAIS